MQVSNQISALSATPYVDAFTTGEILGFVVLIICTQIVITATIYIAIRNYIFDMHMAMAGKVDAEFMRIHCDSSYIKIVVDDISDRLPNRVGMSLT